MKLETINITYFRCFETLKLTLEEDVTLFVGVNGAGKTAILDAIAIALFEVTVAVSGRTPTTRRKQNAALKAADIYLAPGASQKSERRSYAVNIRATAKELYPIPNFRRPIGAHDSLRLEWDSHIIFTPPASFSYPSSDNQSVSQIYRYMQDLWELFGQVPDASVPLPAIAYYRSTRKLQGDIVLGDIFSANYERAAAYEGALDAGADFQAMCRWLYTAENQALREKEKGSADSSFGKSLGAMKEALHYLVDDVADFGFEGLPPQLVFEIVCNGTTRKQSLEQLSDGYRNLIGLCLDFARRLALANPNSPNPLQEPGILLIDEIDLHLHPGWQQTVVPKLRAIFPNTQIIATTHSPQVLTSVEGRSIRILQNGQLFAAPAGTLGAQSKQLLEEVLGIDSRPPAEFAQPVAEIDEIFDLLNQDDLKGAREHLDAMIARGYQTDPAIIEAEISLENRLWENQNEA